MTRSLALALALLCALGAPPSAHGQAVRKSEVPNAQGPTPTAAIPFDARTIRGRLPNGLRYFVRANARPAKRAELRLVVDAGSVLEDEDQRGLAHFVEHMAFNGTRRFPKQAIVDYIERVGMRFGPDLNAYTSFDETVYMLQVPTDTTAILARGLDILEDWAHGVAFDSLEIERERGVVIEEWRAGLGAGQRVRDRQIPVLFRDSRYATRLPIGERRVLETAPPSALRRFYRDWYRPDLMTVVAVGDFDPRAVERMVRQRFARVPQRPSPRGRPTYPVPAHDSTLVAVVTDPELTVAQVSVAYKHPATETRTVQDWRRGLVEGLYLNMLNQRLFELTQRPDPPFVNAGASQGGFVRPMETFTLGAAVRGGGMTRGLEAVLREAERVDRHGFTAPELERAKRDYLRAVEQGYDEREKTESDAYADELVAHALVREPAPGVAWEWSAARRLVPTITLDEVNRAARAWIADRNRVILASAPANDSLVPDAAALRATFARVDAAEVAAYADTVSDAPLVADPPAPVAVTAEARDTVLGLWTWTLANGVRVVFKPTDFKADEVLLEGFAPGGTSLAPDSLAVEAGLAGVLVSTNGAGAHDLVTLQKKLAGRAAQAGVGMDAQWEGVGGSASPKDLETMFQLVHLYVARPRTDTVAARTLLQRYRTVFANRAADPEAAFADTLGLVMAQHHPRARPITAGRLDSLRIASAFEFYRTRMADAGDFTFVVVGAASPDTVRALARRWLGTLPARGETGAWRDLGIRPPPGVVERTVRKGREQKAQTRIVFHGDFPHAAPAERYALYALGDVLEMRLRERLREALGGTYGASVGAGTDRIPRPAYSVSIDFGSSPERAEELSRAVFAVIDSLKAVGPTADEVAKVKETMTRERETNLRNNGWWSSQLATYLQNGDDPRGILANAREIGALTADRVRDAARRWLDTGRYVKVVLVPE